ncbi:MAG: hypothetical protein KF833_05180 [Verrucomicrobiae bacterium]|nr:hypothetical protein [Verrucomicrobiae bacterium]
MRTPTIATTLAGLVCLALIPQPAPAQDFPDSPTPGTDNNPYRAIVARNAFRLREPVPPPPPPEPPPPVPEVPKIDVKIAGLAEIGGVRYAYLVVPDTDRPGQFEYPALSDDPLRGRSVRHRSGLEVREIDLKQQTVRVLNGGIETTLNLKENGVTSAPTPAARPAAQAARQAVTSARPANPPGTAASSGVSSEPLIFSRNPNRASGPDAMTAGTDYNTQAGGANFSGGTANLPARPVRTDPNAPVVNAPAGPAIPVEQQYDVLIRQRQVADSLGIPLPPIPGLPVPSPQGEPPPTP